VSELARHRRGVLPVVPGWRSLRAALATVLVMTGQPSPADVRVVDDPSGLTAAIAVLAPGDILELEPGDYGTLFLVHLRGSRAQPVVIRSRDPARPAMLSGLDMRDVHHVTLSGLVFDYVFAVGDAGNVRPFQVAGSEGVVIEGSLFDGDLAQGISPIDDGFPTGSGLALRDSAEITLTGNVFRGFMRGLIVMDSTQVNILGNELVAMRMDAMNLAAVTHVRIEANWVHDFQRSPASDDHPDMIQFWTTNTQTPSVEIDIRHNILNAGHGLYTQSIFMRNEEVDSGRAGEEMFYRDVQIVDNLIINAHLHGISVGQVDGLEISNNTLLHNRLAEGEDNNPRLWEPQIRVAEESRNVAILRNVVTAITGHVGQRDWQVADNLIVQDRGRMAAGMHYDQVFTNAVMGDPADLSSFRPRPDGPLAAGDLGSSLPD
jgi:hypothetical protein